ncbi:hypothetical protein C2E21_5422 [Chlorella sorokiniana]|uniref:SGNH hydrolase-type esterase domain-containing protein n=1 Tax=Chlorella sorokiniana TaxID=3076 RepID=A0A2P6TP94_CHLSO|nr:hypothetical protein C2E21_5422 [Chlorella sorokiniana]|eukprot:PRW51157.1 hypothetical protein C2E21_5422 [Chlorella sorokiniana]
MLEGSAALPIQASSLAAAVTQLEQELPGLVGRHGGSSAVVMRHRVRLGAALAASGRPEEGYPLLEQGLEAATACFASNMPRLHRVRKEAADGTSPDAQQLVATLGALQRTIWEARFFRCLCFVSLHGPAIEETWHANQDTYLAVRHEMAAALPELARWSSPADPMVQCALHELSRLVAQCEARGLQQLPADLQAEHAWLLGAAAVDSNATRLIGGAVPQLPQYKQDIVQRLWQYQPFLSQRSLRRGLYSLGDPARMRRFVHKLLSGDQISVSTLGGSVTAGQGAMHGGPYVARWFNWLNEISPRQQPSEHTLKNPAFGGSTSGIFTVCVNDMVQEDADLVIVEFSLNDGGSTGQFKENKLRLSMERLFRKLLALPNKPAVVVLSHYGWLVCRQPGSILSSYACSAENDFNVMGQYYGLPSLSIRAAAYHLMAQNVSGYQAYMPFRDHEQAVGVKINESDLYYFDEVHPQDRTGHWALADLLVTLTQETAVGLAARPLEVEDEEVAHEPLPEPMTPGNYERRASACLLQRAFEKVVVNQQGFEWKNERPAAQLANEKWGWIGTVPGSWAELEVDTTTGVKGDLAAEQDEVVLTHLISYEHMGKAKVECVSGCQCNETVFDGHVNDKVSLTALHRFPASQSPNCRIRVTVLNETSSPDGEHKVKLVGVMVIEASSNLNGLLGIQLDLFANKGMGELKPPEQPQPEQPQPEQPQEQPQPEQQQPPEQQQEQPQPEQQQPPEQQQEQPQPEQPQPEQPQEQPQPEQQQPEQQVQPQQPAEQPQQRRRGRR